jgi:23S rRNA (uracil1939-C5)-methyltransferase
MPADQPTLIELTLTALSHAGEGIGRHEGRAVFVPFALPGETVRVEIMEEKKTYTRARLVEVLAPSPDRVMPRCPHHFALPDFTPHPCPSPRRGEGVVSEISESSPHPLLGRGAGGEGRPQACGGCQLQHLAYPAQLQFKQQTVIEQLTRLGGFVNPPVRPIVPAPAPFGYRNQAQFHLTPEGQLGFRASHLNEIIPIRECHLLAPALADLFPRIQIESMPEIERLTLRVGAEEDTLVVLEAEADAPEIEIDLPVSAALLRPDGASLALADRDYSVEVVKGRAFKVSAGSFFQVNTAVAELLVDHVVTAFDLRGTETVLDLYCGVGLFSAFLAPRAARVIGVEAFEPAVDDAAVNLDEFDHIEIYCAPVEAVLPTLKGQAEAVVLDPPRAGCAPEVLEALIALRASQIVYVSCDPATLARDAKRLAAGGYRLEWAQPLDMFPQTFHVECVAKFIRM